MAVQTNVGFIIFYVSFYLAVAFFGQQGYTDFGITGNVAAPPQLDSANLNVLTYLVFVFDIVVYFFGLQGLVIFGIPAAWAVLITIPMTTGLVYSIAMLVRGSG